MCELCIVRHTRRDLQQMPLCLPVAADCGTYLHGTWPPKFSRLNAIFVEEKMQLEEQLGKVDSIPYKTTGIRQIYSLTSHPCPLHPQPTFHIRDAHRATPLEIYVIYLGNIGFGGLEVACWPLVPQFAGSNPAEAVGFLRAKKSSARLTSEGK